VSRDPVRYAPVPADVTFPRAPRLGELERRRQRLPSRARCLPARVRAAGRSTRCPGRRRPLALALDVALPPGTDLLDQRDLDNYLLPAVRHLTKATGRPFASVSGTKRHGTTSFFGIGQARAAGPPALGSAHRARTTASVGTSAYKQQIADALRDARPGPPGPVALDIVFGRPCAVVDQPVEADDRRTRHTARREQPRATVAPAGRPCHQAAPALRCRPGTGPDVDLVVDADAGQAVLVAAHRAAVARGGRLHLHQPSPEVIAALRASCLQHLLQDTRARFRAAGPPPNGCA